MIGNLPSELRHLKYLKSLHVEQNEGIVGSIPEQYGDLVNLRYFGLVYNKLTGKIPRSFGGLKKMESFILEVRIINRARLILYNSHIMTFLLSTEQ